MYLLSNYGHVLSSNQLLPFFLSFSSPLFCLLFLRLFLDKKYSPLFKELCHLYEIRTLLRRGGGNTVRLRERGGWHKKSKVVVRQWGGERSGKVFRMTPAPPSPVLVCILSRYTYNLIQLLVSKLTDFSGYFFPSSW